MQTAGLGIGVAGTGYIGVRGTGMQVGTEGTSTAPGGIGLRGSASQGVGVRAISTDDFGLHASSATNAGVFATGATGISGAATSPNGFGVLALSYLDGIAMRADSSGGIAIIGVGGSPDQGAIVGINTQGSAAVHGHSGSEASLAAAPPNTGVYGYAVQDSTSRGVFGQTTTGQGVRGIATSGIGVRGYSASGVAASFESTTGFALQGSGRIKLHQCAGVATIAAGTKSVTVTLSINVDAGSFVLATLNGSARDHDRPPHGAGHQLEPAHDLPDCECHGQCPGRLAGPQLGRRGR